MTEQQFESWFTGFQADLARAGQRRLVLLQGQPDWAERLCAKIFNSVSARTTDSLKPSPCLTYQRTASAAAQVHDKNYRQYLGQESLALWFNEPCFNLDAFAALSGTLMAGGLLLLYQPLDYQQQSWYQQSPFFQRFYRMLCHDEHVLLIQQRQAVDAAVAEMQPAIATDKPLPFGCKTVEQVTAVQAIIKVATGHRNRPMLLTADRGRGKSSALAIACAELLLRATQPQHIIVTAPAPQALTVFFQQLQHSLPDAQLQQQRISYQQHSVSFQPVDFLLATTPAASLLLVDEAAAIPVYLLAELLHHYHRLVFSSTMHGYEGAGRGFSLKFSALLRQCYPNYHALHLRQPIRWAEQDPLEELIFNSCLLNASLNEVDGASIVDASLNIQVLTAATLSRDEAMLSALFAILVTAHYQTSPADLQLLLDNPQVSILAMFAGETSPECLVAVCLLMHEGGAPVDVAAIARGERRLRNQFLPQSLLSHCGWRAAFDFCYGRIMRIAVHPALQGQGIGQQFLQQIIAYGRRQQLDFIGSSFAVNAQLWRFWQRQGFKVTRIGFTQDQASGEHSALVLLALHENAEIAAAGLQREFYRSFGYLLTDEFRLLAPALVLQLLAAQPEIYLPPLSAQDWDNIHAFAAQQRQYSQCVYSLHLWLQHHCVGMIAGNGEHVAALLPLIARIMQKQPLTDVCRHFGFTGKKQLLQHMMATVAQHLPDKS